MSCARFILFIVLNNLVKTESISIDKTFNYNYTRHKLLYMIWGRIDHGGETTSGGGCGAISRKRLGRTTRGGNGFGLYRPRKWVVALSFWLTMLY